MCGAGRLWPGLAPAALSPKKKKRRLGARERARTCSGEILAVCSGAARAAAPRPAAAAAASRTSAGRNHTKEQENAMAGDDDEDGGPPTGRKTLLTIWGSFYNFRDRALGHQEPHWKEFRFDLTQIPTGEAVTAAEFRIYKVPSTRPLNRTLHVSLFQVVQEQSNRESDLFFLDLQTLRAGDEGWLVLDVTAASDRWLLHRNQDLGLRLYVETEDGEAEGLLPWGPHRLSLQSLLVTFFRASASAPGPLKRRQPKRTNELARRLVRPVPADDVHGSGGRQVCRRHELYVSFQDLGWLDWVIAPQGYSAYYCARGVLFPWILHEPTNHAPAVHLMKPDAVPKACCAPTKLSATSVLYYDSSNNVILRKHRNMVVKACGCH
uniref:TGF-beta family profile domain-containing protein n=1 Tax=Microcebus murinus TaxID=30608 RepID=A0A8C5XRN0_MICMU